mmetsp:Transcript_29801/g.49180  ORF Transcript_29801/g.49180 Transcript_29801/m.49180 type:complete len:222 (-) Transcript_29801:706-1371(-)|eukprot:CAMPEP_0119016254 /NCGR_PEP_ID=MMETSP1176-20130426/11897_1 /TAXON_ID=265551 /ORGANISM="Synedropsis recta cf, Strain CCMP1620" /LENGTH=221 /DNA_ID=CAMNT_0006969595 /DNA_START=86 /DNA_END=751 /DNA_ORIENTATION=-
MPFSEVFNALLITYVATEYSLAASSKHGFSIRTFLSARPNQVILVVVLSVNLIDRLLTGSAATTFVKEFFERLLHAPKIMLAAVLYVVVLYADCLRHSSNQKLTFRRFLGRVGIQFLKILPLYPFLAVLISCGFMFLISAFEHLNLPLEWLNWPIYYGTLYGPFSLVYFQVKAKIVEEEQYFIPTITATIPSDFFASPKSEIRDLRLMHFENNNTNATKEG